MSHDSKLTTEWFRALKELVDLGNSITKMKVDASNSSLKQWMLYLGFCAMHNYTGSILILCEKGKAKSAMVLIRSLQELYYRLFYILGISSDRRVVLSIIESYEKKKTIANEMLNFVSRYSNWEGKDEMTDKKRLRSAIVDRQGQIDELKKKYKIKSNEKFPDFLPMVRILDRESKSKKNRGKAEYNYHILYRYSSPYTHLGSSGLENFVRENDDHTYTFDSGPSNDLVEEVLATNYAFYLDILFYMRGRSLISKKLNLKEFNRVFTKLMRSRRGS